MNCFMVLFVVVAEHLISGAAWALPGVAPSGEALAEYDPATGEIVVSFTDIINWYVEDLDGNMMTGDAPLGLPSSGGLLSDSDTRVGESNFSPFSVTNLNLGNIAQSGLGDDGSLQIIWNTNFGSPIESRRIDFLGTNILPIALIDGPVFVDIFTDPLNITLDASNSIDLDGGTLSYTWDLDNDGAFEFDTGLIPTLDIANVSSTFGGLGSYRVAVEVFDGISSSSAATFVHLVPTPPLSLVDAQYDPATGQVVVSVDNVISWYVQSSSSALTGDAPSDLPLAGGWVYDNDNEIGETNFSTLFSYSADLGNVAQPGLLPNDLTIYWYESLGSHLHAKSVAYRPMPEPTGKMLLCVGLLGVCCYRGRWGGGVVR